MKVLSHRPVKVLNVLDIVKQFFFSELHDLYCGVIAAHQVCSHDALISNHHIYRKYCCSFGTGILFKLLRMSILRIQKGKLFSSIPVRTKLLTSNLDIGPSVFVTEISLWPTDEKALDESTVLICYSFHKLKSPTIGCLLHKWISIVYCIWILVHPRKNNED